jgi:phosphoribosyl-AMP cyclohydrolase
MVSELTPDWLQQIRWDSQGLIPAIAQQFDTGEVLMMAWMNSESLRLTIEEGRAVYWSRSRQRLWRKGEESGHVQTLKSVNIDCDCDVLLLKVDQIGAIACHTGHASCFYRQWRAGQWQETSQVVRDPGSIYRKGG